MLSFNTVTRGFFIIAFSFVLIIANAQLKAGVKAGLNVTTQHIKTTWPNSSSSNPYHGKSFRAGFYLIYDLSDVISIQPELIYNSIKIEFDNYSYNQDVSFHYLSMPVMFGYGVLNNKIIFQAGPEFAHLMAIHPAYYGDVYNTFDLSLALGAVYNVGRFNMCMRYSGSVTNLASDEFVEDFNNNSGAPFRIGYHIRCNNLQFTIGFLVFK